MFASENVIMSGSELVCEICIGVDDVGRLDDRLNFHHCTYCGDFRRKAKVVVAKPVLAVRGDSLDHECEVCGFGVGVRKTSLRGYVGHYRLCSCCRIDFE